MLCHKVVFCLLVLISLGTIAQCKCVEGNGDQLRGLVWYKENRPVGCCYLGQKIPHNGHFYDDNFKFTCTYSPENGTLFLPVECVRNEKTFAPGQVLADGLLFYSCERYNDFIIEMKVKGCADKSGRKIEIGQTFETRHFVFRCEQRGPMVQAKGIACIVNGKKIDVGESYIEGDFWFYCKQRGRSGIRKEAAGCVYNNVTFLPNERFMKGNFLFKCQVADPAAAGEQVSKHEAVACYHGDPNGNGSFYYAGEHWYLKEKYPNTGYKVVCRRNGENMRAEAMECYFDQGGRRHAVLDGVGFNLNVLTFTRLDGISNVISAMEPGLSSKNMSSGSMNQSDVSAPAAPMTNKEKYRELKKRFKFLVYENEFYQEELRNLQRKLMKLSRDRKYDFTPLWACELIFLLFLLSFLLDRLLMFQRPSDSSDESDSAVPKKVKRTRTR
ncbi:hypothetical protein TTRE_0000349201 [Trichuris trichiura]|uniref:Uncharacterized protein n=1 Tax=Trichuris trichiura TaxID=36087 RepID=A0A077Z980_TRITR|nr:hypothetical protein TTRE_0000349201 [Trichuris trichiura]